MPLWGLYNIYCSVFILALVPPSTVGESIICSKKYNGASARPAIYRFNEHESSTRLLNDRTTLGQHIAEHSRTYDTIKAGEKGTRDYASFFDKYNLEIVAKCRDTLETFVKEGLYIRTYKQELNNMLSNGFVDMA